MLLAVRPFPRVAPLVHGHRTAIQVTTPTTLGPADLATGTDTQQDRHPLVQTLGVRLVHMADSITTPVAWEVEIGRHFETHGAIAIPILGVDELERVESAIIID
jgi:hypothetical protein